MTPKVDADLSDGAALPRPAGSARTGVIDCFAGVGGFAHALTDPRFGYRLVLTVELDPLARHVYASSFPGHDAGRFVDNIRRLTWVTAGGDMPSSEALKAWERAGMPAGDFVEASDAQVRSALERFGVDPGSVAVVTSGAPCQPWSKGHGSRQPGVRDLVRGTLFGDSVRVAEAVGATFWLGENVPNLAGARHRDWFQTVLERLRDAGYAVGDREVFLSPDRLAPELGGTPQTRKRLFIAARRVDPAAAAADPSLLTAGVDVDELAVMFDWDPARWDPESILDDDESFDTSPYLLASRQRAWVSAWNALLQALPVDDVPTELYVDTFTRNWVPAEGTDPAAVRRMQRSHAFYLTHRRVIDRWCRRTWDVDGVPTRPSQFPASRRVLEWQARSAQPTRDDRDLWQTTFSFRSSGIRAKPLTTLPALVALNTTSAIGPRGRFITPREAARLQGMPAPAYAPPLPLPGAVRAPRPDLDACPALACPLQVTRADPEALADAARRVTDAWFARGGHCDDAVMVAVAAGERAGVSPGEVLVAAGALAARQARWRGSGLAWTSLAWAAYRALAPGHPVAADPVFAALDWRVRRRATLAAVRRAGVTQEMAPEPEALEWFAEHVDVTLPAAGGSWRASARDLAVAARGFGIDVEWTRALLRAALLADWDETKRPLSGLVDLDEALVEFGVAVWADPVPAGTGLRVLAGTLSTDPDPDAVVAGPLVVRGGDGSPVVESRNLGAGMPATSLPLTATTLAQGRARLAQLEEVIESSAGRVVRLEVLGERDPRAEEAALDALQAYVMAAYDLRRHRGVADHLIQAAALVDVLLGQPRAHEFRVDGLRDAATGLLEAWGRHYSAPPFGPVPVLVLPETPGGDRPPDWLMDDSARSDGSGGSLVARVGRADAVVATLADSVGIAGMVAAAHYERLRARLSHVLGLVGRGDLTTAQADNLVFALTRRPSVPALLDDVDAVAAWTVRHAFASGRDWRSLVGAEAGSPGRRRPELPVT